MSSSKSSPKPPQRRKIPIVALQGFLGAGKTTLLNHLISSAKDRKVGVIVNDFGDINIDDKLVANKTDKRLDLSSGCICCSLKTLDLSDAIDQFTFAGSDIDIIIIEASGIAEPRDLAFTLRNTIGVDVYLDSIVTVLDGANIVDNALANATARDQILFTDFVVINKIDLIDTQTLADIKALITSLSPKARILTSKMGAINPELLLSGQAEAALTNLSQYSAKPTHSSQKPHLHDSFTQLSVTLDQPLDPMRFEQFVNSNIPSEVYRAKGIVNFGSKGHNRKYIFQLVGARVELSYENWHQDQAETSLVFIGQGFDKSALRKKLKACIDTTPDAPLPNGIEFQLPKKA